jgi:replication initiation and membrane attachment protein DnaB
MFTLSHFSSRNAGNPLTKAFQCAIFVETTTKKNNKIMMKEMIRKVMEWCKLWNGEAATAKQADPSSDKREKEQAADNREVQDRLENSTCGNTMSSVSTC